MKDLENLPERLERIQNYISNLNHYVQLKSSPEATITQVVEIIDCLELGLHQFELDCRSLKTFSGNVARHLLLTKLILTGNEEVSNLDLLVINENRQ